jgi:hypothetical protein
MFFLGGPLAGEIEYFPLPTAHSFFWHSSRIGLPHWPPTLAGTGKVFGSREPSLITFVEKQVRTHFPVAYA